MSVGLDGNPAFRGQIRANDFAGDCDHGIYFSAVTRDWYYSDNIFHEYKPEPIVDEGEYNYSGHYVGPE